MSVELLEKVTLALDNNNISYLVIGGQAVLVHGRARLTDDIDIIIDANLNDIEKVKKICEDLKLVYLNKDIDNFVRRNFVIPAYDNDSMFRVDIIFAFTEFELNAINRGKSIKVKNKNVSFASLEDLILFKLYAHRVEDISDVKNIMLMNKDYDREYILKWLKKFDEEPGFKLTEMFLDIEKNL
jgi:predicted nucleotidyltransferase